MTNPLEHVEVLGTKLVESVPVMPMLDSVRLVLPALVRVILRALDAALLICGPKEMLLVERFKTPDSAGDTWKDRETSVAAA